MLNEYKILSLLFSNILWFKDRDVYLTFDDGPHPTFTPKILEILKDYRAKATFFLIGNKVCKYPNLVSNIMQEGHTIGLHSYSHQNLFFKSRHFLMKELLQTQKVLKEKTGVNTTIFRPPYGCFTPRLIKLCRQLQFTLIMWSIMSYDFNLKISDQDIIKNIIRQLHHGAIIVFHDGHINSERTVRILPDVLEIIIQQGKLFKCL